MAFLRDLPIEEPGAFVDMADAALSAEKAEPPTIALAQSDAVVPQLSHAPGVLVRRFYALALPPAGAPGRPGAQLRKRRQDSLDAALSEHDNKRRR